MRGGFSKTDEKEKATRIREISLSDVNLLFEIEKASFSSPWTKEALRLQINSPMAFNLLIEVREEIAGYVMCLVASDECHILNFAIHPRFRKRGYGSELFSSALSMLRKRGIRHVFLEVREKNLAAIQLYLKFGFKIIGKRKKYYEDSGEDALVMHLLL